MIAALLFGALGFAGLGLTWPCPPPIPGTSIPGTSAGPAQDPPAKDPTEVLGRLLERAKSGSRVVRPQAARRLLAEGQLAADFLVQQAGDGSGLAGFGNEVVGLLGQFGDPRLRAKLWQVIADPTFPWRPAAARSLADTAETGETGQFLVLMGDPLAAVRAAALESVPRLSEGSRPPVEIPARLHALLSDPDDRVRRASADLLARAGETDKLYWLLEELRRTDHFFQDNTGLKARVDASRRLREQLGESFDYNPRNAPDESPNPEAIQKIAAEIQRRCGEEAPELPEVARAAASNNDQHLVIGLELRSCRHGEIFLRWSLEDTLLVGRGNAAVLSLPEGTSEKLIREAQSIFEAAEPGSFWGTPGCDVEQYYWQPTAADRPRVLRISKGPDALQELRPAFLANVARLLLRSIPEQEPTTDPRTQDLRAHLEATLTSIGGTL